VLIIFNPPAPKYGGTGFSNPSPTAAQYSHTTWESPKPRFSNGSKHLDRHKQLELLSGWKHLLHRRTAWSFATTNEARSRSKGRLASPWRGLASCSRLVRGKNSLPATLLNRVRDESSMARVDTGEFGGKTQNDRVATGMSPSMMACPQTVFVKFWLDASPRPVEPVPRWKNCRRA
jgi:hypothetical protein